LVCNADSVCNIKLNSPKAEILRLAKVIIWDESPMANRYLFEALDRTLQDIRNCEKPFGGITIVLCGDFRQILPVIIRGGRPQIVNACIKKSHLWDDIKVHKLTISQRITNNEEAPEFYNYLMRIGNGTEETFSEYGEDMVRLPNHMVSTARDLEEFVDNIYPSLDTNCSNTDFIMSRAILTPLNEDVDVINDIALQKILGEEIIFKSIDKIDDEDNSCVYPVEFLNSLESNGLPAHNLKLKEKAVIMLLRNLDTASGACNGTRLIVNKISTRVIDATIINGSHANQRFFIPRIPLCPETNILPIKFTRLQFPVRPAFAMTINKSQGQTLDFMGLYLPRPVFVHGQLNVALTRVKDWRNIEIFVTNHGRYENDENVYTKNIVYQEVLDD
jgi:ATP-dependent DNA helicase PIF1